MAPLLRLRFPGQSRRRLAAGWCVRLQTSIVLVLLTFSLASPIASAQPLQFRIVEQEHQKKGGSVNPVRPPRYVLLVTKAVLTEKQPDLTKERVEATLRELLRAAREDQNRRGMKIDGVTAFLYQSPDHVKGGNLALGRAEWWPKGHSFNPDNAANIENKATYVESIEVILLPERPSKIASRFSEAKRQEIYAALVRSEDRAMNEAEAKSLSENRLM